MEVARVTGRANSSRLAALAAFVVLLSAPAALAASLGPLPASFSGVLPCADCTGLRHHLNLYPDGGFVLALSYFRDGRDETFYDVGNYVLSADSLVLSLATHDPLGTRFSVRDRNLIRLLDREGQAIDSELDYDLRREPAFLPIEPRLMLRGSYSYMADAGVFTDCRSGMRFPVAPGPAAAELEQAYLAERAARERTLREAEQARRGGRGRTSRRGTGEPGVVVAAPATQPLLVAVNARIAARPPTGLEGDGPTLIVEHLLDAFPNETCGARGVTHRLEGTRWVLTRIGEAPVRLWPDQREIFITLGPEGRVVGHSGCNRFGGSYAWDRSDSGRLTFGPSASTRMACVGPDYEARLFHVLDLTQGYRVSGAHLELFDAGGEVLARFEARDL
jgi:copper homeostasis protein (lipoprotein)